MTPRVLFDTLLAMLPAWSAQILVLVAIAALASLALAHPKARLIFWQGVLALCFALPLLEPWKAAPLAAITAEATVLVHVAPAAPGSASLWSNLHWRPEYWLALLALGAALRLLWICAGFLRLRGYRLHAEPLPEPPLWFVARTVRWYVSDTLPGPVTYGWLRPSILLPRRVQSLPAALREAIACHELVHVRRADWLAVLAEELARALLWFHPAVWFALSRIQLAREQVVDREAVRLTENRECYLDALVAVAGHRLQPDLAPATLFLKRRHLAARVAEMMKEVPMSRSRITAGVTAVCSAALVAARLAVWLFPLTAPAQTVVDDPGITVDAGGKLLHRGPVHFPPGPRTGGTVAIEASLNSKGEVADARVVSGPEELRREALAGVLEWHYAEGASSPVLIAIRFEAPLGAVKDSGAGAATPTRAAPAPPAPAPGGSSAQPSRVKSIEFVGISPEAEQELRSRLQIREGDTLTPADMQRVSRAVQDFDSHLRASFTMRPGANGGNEAALRIALMPTVNGSGPLPAPPAREPSAAFQSIPLPPNTIRVAGNVQSVKIVSKTNPPYPPLAKQGRIQGVVSLAVTIGADGTVKNVQLISGHPLLSEAAIQAVKQWVFQPTLLNGNPVDVLAQIDVNFTLL